MWTRQWRRPPTDEELTGLVADHLKEEVLAREAKALELDVGDTIVRRRLAQKMAFLLDDTIRTAEPPEAELRALYETRPDLVRTPARVSFSQVFFRREQGDGRARASLAALSDAAAIPDEQGDRLLLGDTFADQDEQALTNLFGASFAQAVLALPVGRWSGPVESGYGLHLVKVTAASPPQARSVCRGPRAPGGGVAPRAAGGGPGAALEGLMRKYRLVVDPPCARGSAPRQPGGGPAMRWLPAPRRPDGAVSPLPVMRTRSGPPISTCVRIGPASSACCGRRRCWASCAWRWIPPSPARSRP